MVTLSIEFILLYTMSGYIGIELQYALLWVVLKEKYSGAISDPKIRYLDISEE